MAELSPPLPGDGTAFALLPGSSRGGHNLSGYQWAGLCLILIASSAGAGGGWVSAPGHGYLQAGFNWKHQLGAQRRDTEGKSYEALNHLSHDFRFAYASGTAGLYPRLEASFMLSYLWASERFDEAAEEPDGYFQGFSDMWVGLKYQVRPGAWPMAVEAVARLPYLYRRKVKDPTGLLNRDLALKGYLSHGFGRFYTAAMAGFNWREAAPANQLVYGFEVGGQPWSEGVGGRMSFNLGLNGLASVGADRPSTFPRDRFSGLTLDRDGHFFNFNKASSLRLQLSSGYALTPAWSAQAGLGYFVWGRSIEVYTDLYAQLGYTFEPLTK